LDARPRTVDAAEWTCAKPFRIRGNKDFIGFVPRSFSETLSTTAFLRTLSIFRELTEAVNLLRGRQCLRWIYDHTSSIFTAFALVWLGRAAWRSSIVYHLLLAKSGPKFSRRAISPKLVSTATFYQISNLLIVTTACKFMSSRLFSPTPVKPPNSTILEFVCA
jgi:hypothetical protein